MSIESTIGGVLGGSRNSTHQEGPDTVSLGVGIVFVEGDKDQGLINEGLVAQSGVEEASEPVTSELSGGIVGIVGHVGTNGR